MKKSNNDYDSYLSFYQPNLKNKTSAEIISEARAIISRDKMSNNNLSVLSGGSGVPRTLGTQRPFTPREKQRTLFGKAARTSRPPSAVNLKYLQYQSNDALKSTTKKGHLSPVKTYNLSIDDNSLLENIDEKAELPMVKRRSDNVLRKTKSLYNDIDIDDNKSYIGTKLILPSLNGLSKPLHRRGANPPMLHSLSEEKEETNLPNQRPFSPLIISKSYDFSSYKLDENASDNKASSDVFNKRRLFEEFKSKSEEVHNEKLLVKIHGVPQRAYNASGNESVLATDLFSKQTTLSELKIPPLKNVKSDAFQNILENLSQNDMKYFSEEDITEMLLMLYNTVEKEISWSNIDAEEKAHILRILYKYIESSNERLLISMARIILALRVTGSNLSGVCKLIFKIARNDKNDHLFLNDNLLELFIVGLGRAEPLHDAECLVYGYGALKFLGMNPTLLERLRPLGVLPLTTLHLKMFNEARSENNHSVGEQGCHGLYQLTGALRNMAGNDSLWNNSFLNDKYSNISTPTNSLLDFVVEGTLKEICRTLHLFADDLDVEINVSRTLSVLSADYECCINLCEQKNILLSIIKLLDMYSDKTPIVVRLNYILGNMVACNNEIRQQLLNQPGSLDVLLKILDIYLKQCWSNSKIDSAENIIIGSDLDGSSGSDEDVMVKTIRVIANMCMNPAVGTDIIEKGNIGGRILSWILRCLRQVSPSQNVELTISCLATLNNLSYYHAGETTSASSVFNDYEIQCCEAICRLLSQDVTACKTESLRVLGNMSRSKTTRDYIVDTGTIGDIVKQTKSDESEASLAAAGVLVNMVADESARREWLKSNGIDEAIHALQNATMNYHWQLAHLLTQVLWNASPLPYSISTKLAPLLLDSLDEQQVFGNMEAGETPLNDLYWNDEKIPPGDSYVSMRLAWEEFTTVAVNLLDKIDPMLDDTDDSDLIPM